VLPEDRVRWEEMSVLPEPWAEGEKDHVLCIEPTVISGRRIRPRPAEPTRADQG
jgi:hypothetical protein